ncbi:MAG TPA: DNRLRE domain-containing protein [Nocardioidaceae bacterium]|nr:DNRLRE domain-containing protein [Nocardioidaceae bacterium]
MKRHPSTGDRRRHAPAAAMTVAMVTAAGLTVASAASLPVGARQLSVDARSETVPLTTCSGQPAADTFTDQAIPATNNGTGAELRVASRTGAVKRAFLRFDLAGCSIPPDAVVRSAELSLYLWSAPSAARTYGAFRLTSAWDETTLTWASAQPSAVGSATATVTTGTAGTVRWDVTTDVQAHVRTPSSSHGWVLRDLTETGGSTREAGFVSREYGTAPPSLEITYYP